MNYSVGGMPKYKIVALGDKMNKIFNLFGKSHTTKVIGADMVDKNTAKKVAKLTASYARKGTIEADLPVVERLNALLNEDQNPATKLIIHQGIIDLFPTTGTRDFGDTGENIIIGIDENLRGSFINSANFVIANTTDVNLKAQLTDRIKLVHERYGIEAPTGATGAQSGSSAKKNQFKTGA